MGKKTLATVGCVALILLAGGIFAYQRRWFAERFQPTTSTASKPIQTPKPTDTPTPTATPTGLARVLGDEKVNRGSFGVVAQYWREEETSTYFPDLWTLVKYAGASHVDGAPRRWAADQAAEHGIKVSFRYTAPPWDPTTMEDYFKSKEAMKAHLDLYNIAQYRNHPGVHYHILCGEPFGLYAFDPRSPPKIVLDTIEVIKFGVEYIKSLDPTHPVTVALNPAGAYNYDPDGLWIEKRKAWIARFIDFVDLLDYHLYLFGDAGSEFWRNPELMRERLVTMLDQVLIPSSNGKPIIIGETGCPTQDFKDWKGEIAKFTEEQQAEYFRIYGEETKKRGIFVFVFKLIDVAGGAGTEGLHGLFKEEKGATMNIPKVAAGLVKGYLSIPPPTYILKIDSTPISVPFTIDGISKTTPYSESLQEGKYTIIMSPNVTVVDIYNFVRWEDGSTNPTRIVNLTSDMSLLATYEDPPQVDETSLRAIVLGVSVGVTVVITVLRVFKRRARR